MDLLTLKKRSEFLTVKNIGQPFATKFFILQCRAYPSQNFQVRFGFTVTKKIGGAVQRNRIKRRFREIVRLHLKTIKNPLQLSFDCVLIARHAVSHARFEALQENFNTAMGSFLNMPIKSC